MLRKILAIFVSVILVLSCTMTAGITAMAAEEDASDVKVFGLFSDTHDAKRTKADGSSASTSNGGIGRVMADIFARAGATSDDLSSLDGVIMAGDIVYMNGDGNGHMADGDETAYDTWSSIEGVQAVKDADKLVFAMGNHEIPLQATDSEVIESCRTLFREKTGLTPEHVKVLGGYTFIAAGAEDYVPGTYTGREAWMKQEIEKALADGSDKPVFLVVHHPIADSTYNTEEESYNSGVYSEDFKAYVMSQPRLVVISGHVHTPAANPQTIRQIPGGCTFVQTSHVSGGNGAYDPYTGKYADSFSNAMMMEISEDNVVTLKRFHVDGNGGEAFDTDWVLDIPAMVSGDNSAYKYTDSRSDESLAPVFAAGTEAEATDITPSSAIIKFPAAQPGNAGENSQIQYYKYSVMDMDNASLVKEEIYMSDFYKPLSKQESVLSYAATGLNANTSYRVTITPVTAFFKEAAYPLTADFVTEKNVSYIGDRVTMALDAAGTNVIDTNLERENNKSNGYGTNYGGSWAIAGGYVTFQFDITDPGVYRFTSKIASGGCTGKIVITNTAEESDTKTATANVTTGGFSSVNDDFYWTDMALTEGSYKVTVSRPSGDSLRLYNVTIGKIAEISAGDIGYTIQKNVAERTDGVYLGNPNTTGGSALSAGNNGYITWQLTPEYTGIYSIAVDFNASSATTCTLYNSTYSERSDDNKMGDATVSTGYGNTNLVEFGKMPMIEGQTYTFTLFNPKTNTEASPYVKHILATWEEDIDPSVTPVAISKKYSDRKDTSITTSWAGMDSSSWITFDVKVPVDAIYKASVVAGVHQGIDITVATGAQSTITHFDKTAENNVDNLAWNTKAEFDVGTFALKAGTHEFRISSSNGGTMLFSTFSLTSVDEYELATDHVTISATDYSDAMSSTQAGHIGANGVQLPQTNYWFEYDFEVSEANYMLSMYYGIYSANPDTEQPTSMATVYVDGVKLGTFPLEFSNGYNNGSKWTDLSPVRLSEGTHTVKFTWDGGGDKGYSLGKFALDVIEEPVTNIYAGTMVNADTLLDTLTDEEGKLTARTMLPKAMENKPVTMVFALYEDGTLCGISHTAVTAKKATIIAAVMNNVSFMEGKTYTSKVLLIEGFSSLAPYYPATGVIDNK